MTDIHNRRQIDNVNYSSQSSVDGRIVHGLKYFGIELNDSHTTLGKHNLDDSFYEIRLMIMKTLTPTF